MEASSVPAPHPQSPLEVPYTVQRTILGEPVSLSIATHGGQDWYDPPALRESGTYDIAELRWADELGLIPSGSTVFDVGAHQGVYSLYLARRVGAAGRVVAFEPIRRNTEIAERNVELNGLENVEVVTAAVGARPGRARLNLDSTAIAPDGSESVEVIALDDRAERPALLKIDVEGYEAEVLRGARRILDDVRPHLLLELHPQIMRRLYGGGIADTLALVDWDLYDCWTQRPDRGFRLERGLPDPGRGYDEHPENLWVYARARRRPRLRRRIASAMPPRPWRGRR